jgi:hypothetical protein
MAVFRVEKSKNYTVMSNYHLKDKGLSLKSKGLLSMILSLPDDWNYTTRGLAAISKDGVDSIGAALKELEKAGYLVRNRLRDGKGRITDTEYVIYEYPQTEPDTPLPDTDSPYTEKPYMDNPDMGRPDMAEPDTVLPAQLNTNQLSPKELSPNVSNIYQSIPQPQSDAIDRINAYGEIIKENISYDYLCKQDKIRAYEIHELFEIMLETVCSTRDTIRVGREDMPAEVVKSRLLKLDYSHIEYVMESMDKTTTDVRDIRSYLLTALYRSPTTITNKYKAEANHDMYGTKPPE